MTILFARNACKLMQASTGSSRRHACMGKRERKCVDQNHTSIRMHACRPSHLKQAKAYLLSHQLLSVVLHTRFSLPPLLYSSYRHVSVSFTYFFFGSHETPCFIKVRYAVKWTYIRKLDNLGIK